MHLPATQKRQQSLKEKEINSNGTAKIEKPHFFPIPHFTTKGKA